jgi:hypothetical protein
MNNTSKTRKLGPSSEVTSVPFFDEAVNCCLRVAFLVLTILKYLISTRLLEAQAFQVASPICYVLQMSYRRAADDNLPFCVFHFYM